MEGGNATPLGTKPHVARGTIDTVDLDHMSLIRALRGYFRGGVETQFPDVNSTDLDHGELEHIEFNPDWLFYMHSKLLLMDWSVLRALCLRIPT